MKFNFNIKLGIRNKNILLQNVLDTYIVFTYAFYTWLNMCFSKYLYLYIGYIIFCKIHCKVEEYENISIFYIKDYLHQRTLYSFVKWKRIQLIKITRQE